VCIEENKNWAKPGSLLNGSIESISRTEKREARQNDNVAVSGREPSGGIKSPS